MKDFEYLPSTDGYKCLVCGSDRTTFSNVSNKERRLEPLFDREGDEIWVESDVITETVVVVDCPMCHAHELEVL